VLRRESVLYVCANYAEDSRSCHLVTYVRLHEVGELIPRPFTYRKERHVLLGADPVTLVRSEALRASQRWAETVDALRNPL
jgi:hypothetical protein